MFRCIQTIETCFDISSSFGIYSFQQAIFSLCLTSEGFAFAQVQDGEELVIGYNRRDRDQAERNYATAKR